MSMSVYVFVSVYECLLVSVSVSQYLCSVFECFGVSLSLFGVSAIVSECL